LIQFFNECPYRIEKLLTDNGKEYKWTDNHALVKVCEWYTITQAFTKVRHPRTNGKAERFIRTLMEMRHEKEIFNSREDRKKSLKRFLNWYNTVKPHKWLDGLTPYEVIEKFYYGSDV
jgi:transposase InsO family protein